MNLNYLVLRAMLLLQTIWLFFFKRSLSTVASLLLVLYRAQFKTLSL